MVDGPYNAGSAHLTIKPQLVKDWKSRLKTQVEGRRVEGTVFMNPELVSGFATKAREKANAALKGKNVSVKVDANLTGFVSQLNGKLRPLDNKSHVKVKATANMTGFVKDLNEKLRPLDNKSHVKVQVDPNLAGLAQRIRTGLQATNLPTIKLDVEPKLTGLVAKLSGVDALVAGKTISLPVDLDFTIAKAQLAAFKASAGNITLNVDLDSTGATAQLSALMAQAVALRALLHNIPVGTSGGIGGLGRGARGLLSTANLVKGSLAAIGAVNLVPIIGQLAQMGSLLLTLPAAATAAAAGIAALAIGSVGVFKAFKAGSDMSKNAAKEAEQSAKAQASAQKQLELAVESATDTQVQGARQVASAERGVESAQKSAVNAQKDLTRARKDAVDQIDDLNRALKGSVLDEREAELAVRRAKQRIAEVSKSGNSSLDRDEARVGYQRAIQNLEDVRHRNQELAAEAADANRKGVEGADGVVAAKERAAEADQGVADALREQAETQTDVARANQKAAQQVAEAQTAVAEAMADSGDSAKKYEEALANLSPAAASFVKTIRGLGGEWEDLRLATQESLFSGLDADASNLIKVNLPTLKQGLVGIAGELNGITRKIISAFAAPDAVDKFGIVLDRVRDMFARMEPGFFALAGVFKNLTTVASEFFAGFGDGFTNGAQKLERWSMDFDHIRELIRNGIDAMKDFWAITANIGGSIGAIFKGSREEGDGMIASLKDATGKMRDYLKSAEGQEKIKEFFRSFREMLDRITPLLGDIGRIIVNSVVPAMEAWGSMVGPIIGGIIALLERFPGLTEGIIFGFMAWKTLSPIIGGVTTAITTLGLSMGAAGALGIGVAAAGVLLWKLGEDQRKAKQAAEEHEQAIKNLRNTLDEDTGKVTKATTDDIRGRAESDGQLGRAMDLGVDPQQYMAAIVENDPAAYNRVRSQLNSSIVAGLKKMPGQVAQFERDGISLELVAAAIAGEKDALAQYREYEARPGDQTKLESLKNLAGGVGDGSAGTAAELMSSINRERQNLGLSKEGWRRENQAAGGGVPVTQELRDYFRNLKANDESPLAGIEIDAMPNNKTIILRGEPNANQVDALRAYGLNPVGSWDEESQRNVYKVDVNGLDARNKGIGPLVDEAISRRNIPGIKDAPAGMLGPAGPAVDLPQGALPLATPQGPTGPPRADYREVGQLAKQHGAWSPEALRKMGVQVSDEYANSYRPYDVDADGNKVYRDTPAGVQSPTGAPGADSPAAEAPRDPNTPDYTAATAAWDAYADSIKNGYEAKIRPTFDGIIDGVNRLRDGFTEGLQKNAAASWSEFVTKVTGDQGALAIQVSFGVLTESLYDLANHFTIALVQNAAQREIDLVNSTTNMVSTIGQIHFFSLGIALDNLALKFSDTVTGIGKSWDGMKGSVANPINWIIEKVLNTGLRDAWNSVRTVVPDLPEWTVNVPKIEGFSTGGIMSGYAPGVDDRVIAVGPGEAVMRPEFVAAMGSDYVNSMNAAARTGGVSGVRKLSDQIAGYYSNGGIVDSMAQVVGERFPMLLQGGQPFSGLRFTDSGYHSKGMAADFSNGGDAGSPEMQQLAGWIAANWTDRTIQLIHSPFNHNIGDRKFVGDGMGFYGASEMANHRNHVHWAVDGTLDGRPANLPPLAGGMSFGAAAARLLQDKFEKPLADLRGQMPDFGPSLFGQVPGKLFDAFTGAAGAEIRKLAGRFGSLDAGNTAWDISAGVEQWHNKIVAALTREGWDPSERNIMLFKKQMMTESGGNPNIIQTVQDVNSGGNEGVGLMQVIPNTFAAYRNPTLPNDRTDPDANLSAALRWYRFKWGDDLGTQWGKNQGYDQGGIANGIGMMPKFTLEPERVLSPQQTKAFETLVKVLKDPKFIEAITAPYTKINPWRDPAEEVEAVPAPVPDTSVPVPVGAPGADQAAPVPDWVPAADAPIVPDVVDPVQQAKEAEMAWFDTMNPEATLFSRATELADSQAQQIESWLRDSRMEMAETALSAAAGPLVSISGGIHTTDWGQAQRQMDRSIGHAVHRYSRKGGR